MTDQNNPALPQLSNEQLADLLLEMANETCKLNLKNRERILVESSHSLRANAIESERWERIAKVQQDVCERIKIALDMPGTGSYVDFATDCRRAWEPLRHHVPAKPDGAVSELAKLKDDVIRLEAENARLKISEAEARRAETDCRQIIDTYVDETRCQQAALTAAESENARLREDSAQLKDTWAECVIALEPLRASDAVKPIAEIGPELRCQINTAVLMCREYAARAARATPPASGG